MTVRPYFVEPGPAASETAPLQSAAAGTSDLASGRVSNMSQFTGRRFQEGCKDVATLRDSVSSGKGLWRGTLLGGRLLRLLLRLVEPLRADGACGGHPKAGVATCGAGVAGGGGSGAAWPLGAS